MCRAAKVEMTSSDNQLQAVPHCSRLVVVNCLHLNMTLFVESQSYISPPSFTFVSAPLSELNQNKKKKLAISNVTPFLGM